MATDAPVEEIYQKLSQLEHILLRPDTYIGSTERTEQKLWVCENEKFIYREISYVEGLYKIFDEIIVNAADNKQRDSSMNAIKSNIISVWNNGKGIPITKHKEYNIYVPELIFGHLLTSSNYNDEKKKVTGGRNGYGAKLTNIFSKEFIVETCDGSNHLHYYQKFTNNMQNKKEPKITTVKSSEKDYTKITFSPDLARFGMSELEDDIIALMYKRVYDLAGILNNVKVYLNGELIKVKDFAGYVSLYTEFINNNNNNNNRNNINIPINTDTKPIYIKLSDRWEVAASVTDGTFRQVSFVNGICTTKGGQHVNYIADQICEYGLKIIQKELKKNKTVKAHHLKNYLCLFVNCLIENPSFDSQTKETLTTRPKSFGSDPQLPKQFLDKICGKGGLIEAVKSWAQVKQTTELKKKGGTKTTRLLGISKLDDANCAGTRNSEKCTLILTEGDSAKAFAVSGLSIVGRDYYGIFPLRGKLLNVRDASHDQIIKNEEIQNIVKIMGLKYGQKYTDTKSLRYGSLMIMADQDFDGSHIKGLLVNFIHTFWPSLLQCKGFLKQFITPIVKVTKNKQSITFYTMQEYETWFEENNEGKGWTIKYYKGLGTSSAKEAQEYFSDLDTHIIPFSYNEERDSDLIKMAFEKKKTTERKEWINKFHQGDYVNYKLGKMDYDQFINKELIQFSIYDNCRSIPCFVDGFKPAQRKILFGAFKRNLKSEIKVAQLTGYVSEHAAYHHGDASLAGTIVGMAQNFVGSNNINLLYPSGQFGTRLLGGKDSASPRYIYTRLEKIARLIFHPDDDAVLNYLTDDGQSVEPEWYVPVIPMILVNGCEGIGTGWSTYIPNYNPSDIIKNIRLKLSGQEMEEMRPWYKGFKGIIEEKTKSTYTVHGRIDQVNDTTVRITELPIKKWTQDYKQFLESMMSGNTSSSSSSSGNGKDKDKDDNKSKAPKIKDFKENHTDTKVDFIITLTPEQMGVAEAEGLEKYFKTDSSLSTTNMNVFDAEGHIKKYVNPLDMIEDFFPIRIEYYQKRKDHLLNVLEDERKKMSNKVRFILSVVNDELKVHKRKAVDICNDMKRMNFDLIYPKSKAKVIGGDDEDNNHKNKDRDDNDDGEDELSKELSKNDLIRGYDYLLSMKISTLTKERVEQLQKELREKEEAVEALRSSTPTQLWLKDLQALEDGLEEMKKYEENIEKSINKARKEHRKKNGGGNDEWDDNDYQFEYKKSTTSTTATTTARKPRAKKDNTSSSASSKIVPILPIAGVITANSSNDDNEEDDKVMKKSKKLCKSSSGNAITGNKRGRKVREEYEFDDYDDEEEEEDVDISDILEDDDDEEDNGMEESFYDDEEIITTKPKKTLTTTTTTKTTTRSTRTRSRAKKEDLLELEAEEDNEFPLNDEPPPLLDIGDMEEEENDNDEEEELPKPKQKAKRAPRKPKTPVVEKMEIENDDDDDDDEILLPKSIPKSKPTKRAPRKPKAEKIEDNNDDDDEEEVIKPKTKTATRRAATTKKPKYTYSDDDEEEENVSDVELSDIDFNDDDDDDDDEEIISKPKKQTKPKEKETKPKQPRKPRAKKENIPPSNKIETASATNTGSEKLRIKKDLSKPIIKKPSVFDISDDDEDSVLETLAQRIRGKKFEISPVKKKIKASKPAEYELEDDEDFE